MRRMEEAFGPGHGARAAICCVALLLLLTALAGGPLNGEQVTSFSAGASVNVSFPLSGGSKTVNLTLPAPALNPQGSFAVSAIQSFDPRPLNVTLDVGDDGSVDYAFAGPSYGPWGNQTQFSSPSGTSIQHTFDGTPFRPSVRLPKDADVTTADLTLTSASTLPQALLSSGADQNLTSPTTIGLNSTALPPSGIAPNATLDLTNVTSAVSFTDVTQNVGVGAATTIFGVNQVAQSFLPGEVEPVTEGELTSVEVFTSFIGTPADALHFDVFESDGNPDYDPQGVPLGSTSVALAGVTNNGFTTFTLNPSPVIDYSKIYVFVISSPLSANIGNSYGYSHDTSGAGLNSNSVYPSTGCWEHSSIDSGTSWIAPQGSDLQFRTHMREFLPAALAVLQNLTIGGGAPDTTSGSNATYFFDPAPLNGSKVQLNLTNDGTDDVRFNWSLEVGVLVAPSGLELRVEGQPGLLWDGGDEFVGPEGVNAPALGSALQDALFVATEDLDSWGNPMSIVMLNISGEPGAIVTLAGLAIHYNYTATVSDLEGPLEDALAGAVGNGVTVPIVITSEQGGTLRLSALDITLDVAPRISGSFPAMIDIPEEGADDHLLDLAPFVIDESDPLTMLYAVVQADTGAPQAIPYIADGHFLGLSLSGPALDNWTGQLALELSVRDQLGQETPFPTLLVNVSAVNDPPVYLQAPPSMSTMLSGETFDGVVQLADNDSLREDLFLSLGQGPTNLTITRTTLAPEPTFSLHWASGIDDVGLFSIRLSAGDRDGALVNLTFFLNVSQSNRPPELEAIADRDVIEGVPFTNLLSASDPDEDALTYTLLAAPTGMVLQGASLSYTPPLGINGSDIVIEVQVSDGHGHHDTGVGRFSVLANHPPSFQSSPLTTAQEGTPYRYPVVVSDSEGANVTLTLLRGPVGMYLNDTTLQWDPFESPQPVEVVLEASDGLVRSRQQFLVTVSPLPDNTTPTPDPFSGFLLPLLLALLLGAIVIALVVMRRRKGPVASVDAVATLDESGGGAPAEDVPPQGGSAGSATAEGTTIEDIFVISPDGLLILHETRRLSPDVDSELVGSMFTAIQQFAMGSLTRGKEQLRSMEYGGNTVLLDHGSGVYVAVVIAGKVRPRFKTTLRSVVTSIELQFGEQLRGWKGNREELRGIKPLLKPLLEMARPPSIEERLDEKVRLLGAVEFYRGYVRLKVALLNEGRTVITDASLKLVTNERALRLRHVEPDFPLSGREVALGNVSPGEKTTLAFYLDPLICVRSNLDATVTYRDPTGELRTIMMPKLTAEVVCPILHTEEDLNVAMLRELLPTLRTHDSKLFRLSGDLAPKAFLGVAQEVIQGHDVREVRTFEETVGKNYHGEAWYFGVTKYQKEQLVIRATVRQEEGYLEFFVASSDLPAVTGLLAELGHQMVVRLRELGADPEVATEEWSPQRKEELLRQVDLLLHKASGQAEIGAQDDETGGPS